MTLRLLKRAGRFLLFFWAAGSLTFFLVRAVPGDPLLEILGPNPDTRDVLRLKRSLQLDRPLAAQYAGFILRLAVLDLGESLIDRKPVTATMLRYLPNTRCWPLAAMALTVPLLPAAGIPFRLQGKPVLGKRWPWRSRRSGWRSPSSSSASCWSWSSPWDWGSSRFRAAAAANFSSCPP